MTTHFKRSFCTLGLAIASASLLATTASAQGFNVDFDDSLTPAPTASTYAAAGTAGTWNSVDVASGISFPLVDKSGAASAVTMTVTATMNLTLNFDNVNLTGEDANLMEDIAYGSGIEQITFSGLANGIYDVYTYAMAPDNKTGFITGVAVQGSADPLQQVGGSIWAGTHVQGQSFARHSATVTAGTIVIDITAIASFESVNGIQIELAGSPGNAYCFGDGTGTTCPCAAFGGPGGGCLTTSGTGATLVGTGAANVIADSLVLTVTGAPANKPGLFFQGPNQITNVTAGDGVLCSNASMRYGVNATDASGTVTQIGFGVNAVAGQTLNYQYWFRDTGNACNNGGFNFSNGWVTAWQ